MAEKASGKKPKKKRGKLKGSKNKAKAATPKKEKAKLVKASASIETMSADKAAALVESTAKQSEARLAELRAAAEAAAKKEYEAAAAEAVVTDTSDPFTHKRGQDQIFRREMGEPEFWLDKGHRGPPKPVLSQDEEQAISRQVQIPADQTPAYNPQHVLSPEYAGVSHYELSIKNQRDEIEQRLARLKGDPNASAQEINQAEEDLKTLDYLYQNYYDGMNVFRTAKGGRSKLRE